MKKHSTEAIVQNIHINFMINWSKIVNTLIGGSKIMLRFTQLIYFIVTPPPTTTWRIVITYIITISPIHLNVECLITIKNLIVCQEVFLSYQNRFTTDNNNAQYRRT